MPVPAKVPVASALKVFRCFVQLVFNTEYLNGFLLQRVQLLLCDDHLARVPFVQWYLQQRTQNLNLPAYVFFIEAAFNRDSVFNQHKEHFCLRRISIV
ncbi:hypothetical protein CEXT_686141 [Caerostris extrusa]|uniref:Uncharacterized protein n=1 Tax=Caerostris extrusa TaxID=172846 RepID=A0AAV4MR54_CAEEX|nr:hypothetical protein CEXT_686141 [Caerostris extrusa]